MAGEKIIKGKNLRISVGGKALYHATSCSMSITTNIESIATKDTNGNVKTAGAYDWTMSTSALVAVKPTGSATHISFAELLAMQLANTPVTLEFTTDEVGEMLLTGSAIIESCNISAETEGAATGDFSFSGDGNLTMTTVPNSGS